MMDEFKKVLLGINDNDELVVDVEGIYRAKLSSLLGGGGITVFGPYTVDFDTPDVNNQAFFVPDADEIPDGFWIIDSLVEFTEEWGDGGDQGTFTMQAILEISPSNDASSAEWINKLDPGNGAVNIMNDSIISGSSPNMSALKRAFRLDTTLWSDEISESITSGKLTMEIYSNRDPFTKGQFRVWALGIQT